MEVAILPNSQYQKVSFASNPNGSESSKEQEEDINYNHSDIKKQREELTKHKFD